MEFDSAGQTYDFESAGMMDIRGSLNGEEIFFAPNKSLDIEMASSKFGNDYNTYVLNDSTGEWKYVGEHTVSVSQLGQKGMQLQAELDQMQAPVIPMKPHKNSKILNIKGNWGAFASFKNVLWEYEARGFL